MAMTTRGVSRAGKSVNGCLHSRRSKPGGTNQRDDRLLFAPRQARTRPINAYCFHHGISEPALASRMRVPAKSCMRSAAIHHHDVIAGLSTVLPTCQFGPQPSTLIIQHAHLHNR